MDSSPRHFEQSSLNSPQAMVPANASRLDYPRRLADVRQQIRCLQEEETALEQELYRLAPVRRIPDDILREVFVHSLPKVVTVTPSDAPILLTHVCQRWRKVAIGFVLLWRQILINCRKPTGATQAASELTYGLIGSTLLTSVGRSLTRLTLYNVPFSYISFSPSSLLPCLERLILSLEDSDESPDQNTPIVAFMNAPSLRYVSLRDWDWLVITNQVDIRLPWQQLTHLLYTGDSVAYHIPLCLNLAYLHIELNEDESDPDPWCQLSGGQCLKSLEGLFLYFPNDFYYPIEIFEKYRFPNLKSLRFEADQLPARREAHDYLQKALSGFSNLTHLSLRCRDYGQLRSDGIRALLKPVSNIRTLDIELRTPLHDKVSDDGDDWDRFFSTLAWNHHDPAYDLVPQLQTLIIRPKRMADTELEQPPRLIPMKPHFLTFISTRMVRPVEQRLQRIVAYLTHPLDRRSIKQYIDGGLEYVEYPARETVGQSDAWMDDDPALYDWPELQHI